MKTLFRLRYDSRWGEELFLTGNSTELGKWNPNKAVPMEYVGPGIWSVCVETQRATSLQTAEYKYFIRENDQIRWEDGPNRILSEGKYRVWDWFGLTERHTMKGVAVPLFSLRTEDDFGIGEYADLPKLGDWCVANGMNIIQILPINDTTAHYDWHDSYPYNAISAFALNPIYLNLNALGIKEDAAFKRTRTLLNKEESVNYPKVLKTKWKYFQIAFEQQWDTLKETAEFQQFVKENEDWLHDYAQYCAERDGNGTEIHLFLQYHCDKQLCEAVKALHDKGLLLKGDIPIGVNPSGVDVKSHPDLFNLDVQVGAPPDDFAAEGQNWGFPSYNWEAMAKDGYAWWQRRLQVMARYFDAYRIDHILGFFRIWEIPCPHKSGLMGHFSPALPMTEEEITRQGVPFIPDMYLQDRHDPTRYHIRISAKDEESYKNLSPSARLAFDRMYEDFFYHRHNDFWYGEAMKKLPALTRSTQMIVCGEDLGMIPACVERVMNQLQIMSLEIQSMPKAPGLEFGRLKDNPQLSVCTISSHDTPTLRGWWEEDYERSQRYYTSVLHMQGDAPHKLPGWLCEHIIRQHLACPSAFCILTLQDWFSIDEAIRLPDAAAERINIPANPRHYWRYRMHISLENLLKPNSFTEHVKGIVYNV